MKRMVQILLVSLLLTGCTAVAEHVPEKTEMEPVPGWGETDCIGEGPEELPDENQKRILEAIRMYFAGLGTEVNGVDLDIGGDERGIPYLRMFRYEVSEIDLRQYLEETMIAHFEHEFEDVTMERSEITEIFGNTGHPGVMTEYRVSYSGAGIRVILAAVRDGNEMVCFTGLGDDSTPVDFPALIEQAVNSQN